VFVFVLAVSSQHKLTLQG